MPPLEILTMLGSTVIGGLGKIVGMWMKKKQMEKELMMAAAGIKREMVQDARQVTNKAFSFTRRTIALTIVFAVFLLPPLAAIFFPDVPITIGYTEIVQGFWPFTDNHEVIKWVSVPNGLAITPLHTHAVMAVIGLYFGYEIVGKN